MKSHTYPLVRIVLLACLALPLVAAAPGPWIESTLVDACSAVASDLAPVVHGTASGGGYQLESLVWRVSGSSGGAPYQLQPLDLPALRGSGCCCTYLPLVLRRA